MDEEKKVDKNIVDRLQKWIVMRENQNIQSREKGDADMIKLIKKRIEEEVDVTTIN